MEATDEIEPLPNTKPLSITIELKEKALALLVNEDDKEIAQCKVCLGLVHEPKSCSLCGRVCNSCAASEIHECVKDPEF